MPKTLFSASSLRTAGEGITEPRPPLYVLLHSLPETGRVKVVGIYSSRLLAEEAHYRAKVLPGFSEEPEGFIIDQYEVDSDHWPRGFIRL